jgi:hypothetical protein
VGRIAGAIPESASGRELRTAIPGGYGGYYMGWYWQHYGVVLAQSNSCPFLLGFLNFRRGTHSSCPYVIVFSIYGTHYGAVLAAS